jgi:FkbM family methyltransferase
MSLLSNLKRVSIRPLYRNVLTEKYGSLDSWCLLRGSLHEKSKIISAGVGKSITFEEDIIRRHNARVILLDPSETGLRTMNERVREQLLEFKQVGLAGSAGAQYFARPDRADEGSFRKGTSADDLSFKCVTVGDVMREQRFTKVDLLKIDIEGFEYEVLDSLLNEKLKVDQICIELHTDRQITIEKSIFDAYALIIRMYLNGYRIIYNHAMDFTFVRATLISSQRASQ